MTDIDVAEGQLTVRSDAGAIKGFAVPDGYSPMFFRSVVAALDTWWGTHGTMPSPDTLAQLMGRDADDDKIASVMLTPEFQAAVAYRGVTASPEQGLSLEQQAAIKLMSDPFDKRTGGTKLRELGVAPSTYQSWMQNPLFAGLILQRSENNMRNGVAIALNTVVSKAESGDLRAAEKVLEITGRHDPAARAVANAQEVVRLVMEAVVSEVKDPAALQRILSKAKAARLTLEITERDLGS